MNNRHHHTLLLLILLSFVAFHYLRTMPPSLYAYDSIEIAVGAATLGIIHSPGYAVYLLLGHLFTYLPVGDIAYRLHLLSATATLATLPPLCWLCYQLTRHPHPAYIATLTYAFTYYAWSLSIIAEVYTFQLCLLAYIITALYHWHTHQKPSTLYLATFLFALSCANSPIALFWLPGLLIFLKPSAQSDKTWRQLYTSRYLIPLTIATILGLLPLLYLPWRSSANTPFNYIGIYDAQAIYHPFDLSQPQNLFWYLRGGQFNNQLFGYSLTQLPQQLFTFTHQLWAAFLGIGLPLGLWGWSRLIKQHTIPTLALTTITLSHATFFITYRAIDKDTMFLPVYFIWTIFIAAGITNLQDLITSLTSKPLTTYLKPIFWLLPLTLLLINYNYVDLHQFNHTATITQQRLTNLPPNSYYFAIWHEATALEYYQIIDHQRPDITVINTFFVPPPNRIPLINHLLTHNHPVYIDRIDTIIKTNYAYKQHEFGFELSLLNP